MNGIICSSSVYKFEDVVFEFNHYIGPWPLKKNGDPKKYAGKAFFQLYERFSKLPDKEKYCIEKGGCNLI